MAPKPQPAVKATPEEQSSFVLACRNGDIDRVADVLAQHPDAAHWRDPETANAGLAYAASAGIKGYDVAVLLLGAGADVNAQNNDHQTALHLAARKGSESFVELLLAHHADLSLVDNQGKTAGDLAFQAGHKWVLEEIAKHNKRTTEEKAAAKAAHEAAARKAVEDDIARLQNGSATPVTVRKTPLKLKPF